MEIRRSSAEHIHAVTGRPRKQWEPPLIAAVLGAVPAFRGRGFNLPFPSRAASELQQPHSLMLTQTREVLTEALFEYGDVS